MIKKHKEVITYVIFGILTTAVNFAVFWLCSRIIGERYYLLSNILAWVCAVSFAFVTNKLWVFESKSWHKKTIIKEISEFVLARLLSLGIEEAGLIILVEMLKFKQIKILNISGELIAKIILAVIIVILNYIFSKFLIFKRVHQD